MFFCGPRLSPLSSICPVSVWVFRQTSVLSQVSPVSCHCRGRFSCRRPCGRPLACGNHTCRRECHLVDSGDQVTCGSDSGVLVERPSPTVSSCLQCDTCEEGCSKPRPPGCPHTCLSPCHPGNCPPCSQTIRQRCHCKITTLFLECTSVGRCAHAWS